MLKLLLFLYVWLVWMENAYRHLPTQLLNTVCRMLKKSMYDLTFLFPLYFWKFPGEHTKKRTSYSEQYLMNPSRKYSVNPFTSDLVRL